VPGYRCDHYENQKTLNAQFERTLIANALGVVTKDAGVQFDNLLSAICYGRPILFLEHELGAAFTREQLPSDLHVGDVRFKWPQMRVMLPLNLCTIRRNGMSRSLAYIDICLLDDKVRLPERYEAELENYVRRVAPATYADPRRRKINELCYRGDQRCLCLATSTDSHKPASFVWVSAWTQDTLSQLINDQPQTEFPHDDTDEDFLRRIRHLAFSILLFLSQTPIEYTPATILRKERQEGKHLLPALCKARFVGDAQRRPLRPHIKYEPTGRHVAAHWKAGSWRRIPCGPRHSERKLTWIEPYPVGELRYRDTSGRLVQ
jgi:hypothetical protein